jgi:hypothetical protein
MLPILQNQKEQTQFEEEKYDAKLKNIIKDFTEINENKSLQNEATLKQLRLTLKSFTLSGVSKNPQV